ncbi:MAG: dethiobiotin synthase [Chromatiales bacterium]|jgi:dethiobiotin synthetase|nr:dethiobiotin synthase [Chromatiales bacterium]
MTMRGIFITGTDTGVGKTRIAAGLLLALRARGLRAVGMKPVSCGCTLTPDGPRHDDALLLRACSSSTDIAYEDINPYAFMPAVSPHLAAAQTGITIEHDKLRAALGKLSAQADFVVVEGAGGWHAPIGEQETMADIARALALPVVLVAGVRLGGLNHALLTRDAIDATGLPLAGWVANVIDPDMPMLTENIDTLRTRIAAVLLGTLAYQPHFDGEEVAQHLDVSALL